METVVQFLKAIVVETAGIFYDMSPFLMIGLVFAGIIHVYIPSEKIARSVGRRSTLSVIKAALWGVPMPLCSCGVIPAALSLRKHGASKGATVSFLISTPETGIDSIAVTYALLDPVFTVFRPLSALVTAVLCGLTENYVGRSDKEHPVITKKACHICGEEGGEAHRHTHARNIWRIFEYGFVEFLGDISKWLMIGLLAAGIIAAVMPEGFLTRFIGSGFTEMLVMLGIGIPLYICASASTPIAAALIVKGVSPGAALVFLLAGPATNVATITMVWHYLGKRSTAVYLLSIAVVSLLMGFALNWIYASFNFRPVTEIGGCAHAIPGTVRTVCAVALFLLIIAGIVRERVHLRKEHGHEHHHDHA